MVDTAEIVFWFRLVFPLRQACLYVSNRLYIALLEPLPRLGDTLLGFSVGSSFVVVEGFEGSGFVPWHISSR